MSIPASVPPPAAPGFQSKGRARAAANHAKFGTPLPILLPESPLYASALAAADAERLGAGAGAGAESGRASIVRLGMFSSVRAVVPQCVGVLDRATQSVLVSDPSDCRALFDRGFFGKGALSRSEPTWRGARVELVRGGDAASAEKIREQRRKERKQFKIDRARAMMDAARRAEAVLTARRAAGDAPEGEPKGEKDGDGEGEGEGEDAEGQEDGEGEGEGEGGEDGDAEGTGADAPADPDTIDTNALTPQTFLVRPQRPDANRNRGKKAFRRRPPQAAKPQAQAEAGQAAAEQGAPTPAAQGGDQPAVGEQQQQRPRPPAPPPVPQPEPVDDDASRLVEEREHLQLSYPEALFLCGLGVLRIQDPDTVRFPTLAYSHLALREPSGGQPR